jgi:hypothetical protein
MADLNHQIRGRLLIARRCHQPLDGSRRHPESPASADRVRRYIAPTMPNNRTTGALSRLGVALRHVRVVSRLCSGRIRNGGTVQATHQRQPDRIYQNWNLGSRSPGPIFLTISGLSTPKNYGNGALLYTVVTPSSALI